MGCGKVKHFSRDAAMASRRRMNQKRGLVLAVYFCGQCKAWHLGNTRNTRLENLNRVFDRLPASDRYMQNRG